MYLNYMVLVHGWSKVRNTCHGQTDFLLFDLWEVAEKHKLLFFSLFLRQHKALSDTRYAKRISLKVKLLTNKLWKNQAIEKTPNDECCAVKAAAQLSFP